MRFVEGMKGVTPSSHGIETAKPTREFLEANVVEYGGEQNRKKE